MAEGVTAPRGISDVPLHWFLTALPLPSRSALSAACCGAVTLSTPFSSPVSCRCSLLALSPLPEYFHHASSAPSPLPSHCLLPLCYRALAFLPPCCLRCCVTFLNSLRSSAAPYARPCPPSKTHRLRRLTRRWRHCRHPMSSLCRPPPPSSLVPYSSSID